MDEYRTVASRAEHEDVVKASRFHAVVAPVDDVAGAEALVAWARAAYPDAHHHCWAYRIDDEQRFSDDGDPGGTAGRPMLEVFLKRELEHVAGVVVRTFGGRKLGAGGLVRAYSGAIARALDAAGTRRVEPRVRLELRAPFEHVDALLRSLQALPGVRRGEPRYDAEGVRLPLELPVAARAALEAELRDRSRGTARLELAARAPDERAGQGEGEQASSEATGPEHDAGMEER